MNRGVGRTQHPIRTVVAMNWLLPLLRGLGSAGATANAQAELQTAHDRNLRAALLVQRVNRAGAGTPLLPAPVPRVA